MQTVELHLRRLGVRHVEGCGVHEDHHQFSLEEVHEAMQRVRELAKDPSYTHACILMTEKDFARQVTLWQSVFSGAADEIGGSAGDEGGEGGDGRWGAYVLQSQLELVEHDKRFSTHKAMLATMLRLSVDNFRRRRHMT